MWGAKERRIPSTKRSKMRPTQTKNKNNASRDAESESVPHIQSVLQTISDWFGYECAVASKRGVPPPLRQCLSQVIVLYLGVVDPRHTPAHARREVSPGGAQADHVASGHVLASVVSDALHNLEQAKQKAHPKAQKHNNEKSKGKAKAERTTGAVKSGGVKNIYKKTQQNTFCKKQTTTKMSTLISHHLANITDE